MFPYGNLTGNSNDSIRTSPWETMGEVPLVIQDSLCLRKQNAAAIIALTMLCYET